jgi:Putative transposase
MLLGDLSLQPFMVARRCNTGSGRAPGLALERYGAEIPILVVTHTFGARLNFNVHLHILAGRVGLSKTDDRLVEGIRFYPDEITRRWRHTLIDFLLRAIDCGHVRLPGVPEQLREQVEAQRDIWWKPMVRDYDTQQACLRYIARYLRRPPMAEYRIRPSPADCVRFLYKDKESRQIRETELTTRDFLERLADQVPDRYRHSVRYFGLFAPQIKAKRYETFLRLAGVRRPRRAERLRWAASLSATFGYDPLRDSQGNRMFWSHRLAPRLSAGLDECQTDLSAGSG